MNKSDLVAALVDKKNLTEKQATEIVNLMFKGFTNELRYGKRIESAEDGCVQRILAVDTIQPDTAQK